MTETPDNMAEFEAEFDDRGPCDADQFPGQSPSYVDGHCRCLVCAHCGHHTGNAHQGHYTTACRALMRRVRAENPGREWGSASGSGRCSASRTSAARTRSTAASWRLGEARRPRAVQARP